MLTYKITLSEEWMGGDVRGHVGGGENESM